MEEKERGVPRLDKSSIHSDFIGGISGSIAPSCERWDIGWAIKKMNGGFRVFRRGWNGKGQTLGIQFPNENSANTLPYIYIITVDNQRVPWLASQTDLLANDWEVAR